MWELDCEEGWAPKNWCFWIVVLEKTLESPLDCKEIQPVYSEGDQPWDFFGRNDATVETPVLWPPYAKSWLIGKDYDAGRDWGQEEKGATKDEMTGWHHWLNGHESEWTPGVGDGQGVLACCDSWSRKESDTTEWLNQPTDLICDFHSLFYVQNKYDLSSYSLKSSSDISWAFLQDASGLSILFTMISHLDVIRLLWYYQTTEVFNAHIPFLSQFFSFFLKTF